MEPIGAPLVRACFVVMLFGLGTGGCGEDRQRRSAHLAVEALSLRPGQALSTTLTSDVAAAQPTTWSVRGNSERLLVRLEPAAWEAGRSEGAIVFAADWRAPAGETTVTLTRDDGTAVDVVVTVLPPEIRVTVDRAIAPRRELPARPGGEARPASRLEGGGHGFDFARDELIVYGADEATLDALVRRLDGAIVDRFTPPRELDVPAAAVVALPAQRRTSASDAASRLGSALWALEPGATELTVSDELGLDTLRIAAEETRDAAGSGVTVVPSYVFEGAGDFLDGASLEAEADASSGWTGDMFDVPYMRTDGATPIGVGAAWQALDAAGKLVPNSVGIGIIDAGFSASDDFGVGDDCDEWDEPNVFGCGDSDCDWHGMTCALAAAGEADNRFGAAGTGGPVRGSAWRTPGTIRSPSRRR